MKRTIIFLTVFALVILGLTTITKDAQPTQGAVDVNIIKFHFPQPECWSYQFWGKVKSQATGQIVATCGPTRNCVCGPEGVPQGYYYVWGESGYDCIATETQLIWHSGIGFTDVYLTQYHLPRCQ